ncbi:MAG: LamG domain-containing protein, partial [Sedimentisphaerales bacterium]|nr:LamG domain-containing protein [Sedimentisphaerales bacterium]
LLWSDHAGGGDHFLVAVLGRKLAFETGPGGNPNTTSNRDVVTGEWVHVAVTRTETSRAVQLFVNGALDATGIHAGDDNVGSNPLIVIGANTLDSRYFEGLIDEVRAYDRVLALEEIVTAMRGDLRLAWNPSPAMGEVVDIRYAASLSWSAGDGATVHDVYLGTDKAAVEAATLETTDIYKGRQTENSYSLAEPLLWDTTYFWRVDEVGEEGMVARGNVWSFAVADHLIVDGFEGYTDDEGSRIYETWIDGYGTFDNGSQVGYSESPFAERAVVRSGRQSMPLSYSNMGTTVVSEAQRDWDTPQDWTLHDLATLVLYVRGRTENDPMPLYVTVKDTAGGSATVTNANASITTTIDWQEWAIPFSALAPVDLTRVSSLVIGLGRRANPVSGVGLIYVDDIQLHVAR